jgi:hypothetical protein
MLAQAASSAVGLVLALSAVGAFVALVVAPLAGIFVYRARRRPGSRMRRVFDAGLVAAPGVVALVGGLIGVIIGLAYLVGLFVYWLVYVMVATLAVEVAGGRVTFPPELGQIVNVGVLYVGLGLLFALAGAVWLSVVITAAVRRTQRLLHGRVYTNAPPGDPPRLPGPLSEPRK